MLVRRTTPLVLTIALIVLALFAPVADAVFPGRNGKIVFVTAYWEDCGDCGPDGAVVWAAAAGGRPRKIGSGWQASVSPAGNRIAYLSSGIWGVRPDGSDRLRLAGASDPAALAWSSHGMLAFAGGGGVSVLRPQHGRVRLLARGSFTDVAWSPPGTRLAMSGTTTGAPLITTVDLGGANLGVLGGGDALEWSARGWLAFRRDGVLVVGRPGERGRVVARGMGQSEGDEAAFARAYSWSPEGRRLVLARSGGIYVLSASGGKPRRVVRARRGDAYTYAPAWSPDGRVIAYVSGRRILVVPARGGPSRVFTSFRRDPDCNAADDCYDWVASLDWQALRR
jgi:hypothetical protein